TSINDNSIGGTTGSGSPHAGDWRGIATLGEHGSIDLEHASLSYAQTAVQTYSDSSRLQEVTISNSGQALDVASGDISLRGSLSSNEVGIRACDWGTADCTVDATYVNWGSDNGPFPPAQPSLACGAVLVSPWLPNGGPEDHSIFGVANCGGSPTPGDQLAQASSGFESAIASEQIDCSNGFKDACDAIETAQKCLGAAHDLAAQNFPVPVDAKSTATAVGNEFVSKGSAYLRSSTSQIVSDIGHVTGFAGQILGVANTILGLAQAFNQCAP
ncbi:MAG TPA: hypothetical protein VK471_05735, partial [Solirubrobacterales bacterium]|nr:hypothetical protein [Solirubrobacterales bacterium]